MFWGIKKKLYGPKPVLEMLLGGVWVISLVPEGHFNHFHLGVHSETIYLTKWWFFSLDFWLNQLKILSSYHVFEAIWEFLWTKTSHEMGLGVFGSSPWCQKVVLNTLNKEGVSAQWTNFFD